MIEREQVKLLIELSELKQKSFKSYIHNPEHQAEIVKEIQGLNAEYGH